MATCMPKPTRIVLSCDPEFYTEEDQSGIKKRGVLRRSNGLHVVLSRYLLIVSCVLTCNVLCTRMRACLLGCYAEFNKLHASPNGARQLAHELFCAILGLGLLLGYLATSGAKSDVIFLLGDPDFL